MLRLLTKAVFVGVPAYIIVKSWSQVRVAHFVGKFRKQLRERRVTLEEVSVALEDNIHGPAGAWRLTQDEVELVYSQVSDMVARRDYEEIRAARADSEGTAEDPFEDEGVDEAEEAEQATQPVRRVRRGRRRNAAHSVYLRVVAELGKRDCSGEARAAMLLVVQNAARAECKKMNIRLKDVPGILAQVCQEYITPDADDLALAATIRSKAQKRLRDRASLTR